MTMHFSHTSVKKFTGDAMAHDHFEITSDDPEIRRLFQGLEHTIKQINSKMISEIAGDVSKDSFVKVAETVARLRAKYLAKVIELQTTDDISGNDISTLRGLRTMYEEALEGFAAMQHALNRGYFTLSDK